ncbi:transcriptional regulator [Vibrio sp. vnigr-6D03]|uniref:LysR family transcriptional regulator n=1 Tax=Vibrio sp. vnigr-6D03 TaxID=2058088 RepID=UPI000C338A73|nr:LysR family transcriptional regulator [Vibrio sp. vnigr-6D03]PKF79876.1 transcriptional regulator [Vibrio sp. vnigr-6D03]
MHFKLLKDFVCLAHLQNFTAAALERRVTQSAFSRRIKALEDWLGAELINRECKSFELTPQGALFVSEAEAILRKLYNAREALSVMGNTEEKEIAVAAQNSIAQTLFLTWAKRLERRLGSVYVRLTSDKLPNCIELFSQGKVDYMFCCANELVGVPIDGNRFSYTTVGKEVLILVSVPSHIPNQPLFSFPGKPDDPVPFIAYTHESMFGKSIDQVLKKSGLDYYLSRRYENPFAHNLKSMVMERLGLAWLPKSAIENDLAEGRLCRAAGEEWDIEFDVRLYYHHEARSKHEQMVLELSKEMSEELLV